jgi:RNA polymerase sigma-70 factor (subfamily 1)
LEEFSTQFLIDQIQGGDAGALNELCRRYQMRILAAVRLRLGAGLRRRIESWDIVQEVMIDALRGVKKFDCKTEGAFLKYINKVVENNIRDEADRQNAEMRDPAKEVSFAGKCSPDSTNPLSGLKDSRLATPSQIVSLHEDLALLEEAMDRLSADDRELIIAVKIEGRTYAEIGEDLNLSADAVRMRARRAVLALTSLFRELAGESQR